MIKSIDFHSLNKTAQERALTVLTPVTARRGECNYTLYMFSEMHDNRVYNVFMKCFRYTYYIRGISIMETSGDLYNNPVLLFHIYICVCDLQK